MQDASIAQRALLSSSSFLLHYTEYRGNPRNFLYIRNMSKQTNKRNRNAGKSTGKSKSAKYFAKNPKARAKKNAYNKEYHSTPERKKYRAKLNKVTRKKSIPGMDVSHTKSGKLVREKRSTNRARNGKNGKSSKK